MKTLYFNLRLIFSGESVLLVFSIATFLASLANATQWPVLHAWRFCGILTLLLGSTFLLFSSLELRNSPRQRRTIVAACLFFAATVLCLSNVHITRGG